MPGPRIYHGQTVVDYLICIRAMVLMISALRRSSLTFSESTWYRGFRISKRFGVLLQIFLTNSVLRASVTVLIARPDDSAKSCGLIGPSLSSLSNTNSVLFVRLMGNLIFSTLNGMYHRPVTFLNLPVTTCCTHLRQVLYIRFANNVR